MMGLWSIISDQLDKPEHIPSWYFARDDRVQKAFEERTSGSQMLSSFLKDTQEYTCTRNKSNELQADRPDGKYGTPDLLSFTVFMPIVSVRVIQHVMEGRNTTFHVCSSLQPSHGANNAWFVVEGGNPRAGAGQRAAPVMSLISLVKGAARASALSSSCGVSSSA
jgi:hypothetical protein